MGTFYSFKTRIVRRGDGLYDLVKEKELTRYTWEAMNDAIDLFIKYGYECYHTWEGSLGIGNWLIDRGKRGWYVIREHHAGTWNSYQTIEPMRKLTKELQEELDAYFDSTEKENA